MKYKIHQGDALTVLKTMPDESVQCCITSPPYWGLRDYGTSSWNGGDKNCDHVIGEIRTGLGMENLGKKYRGGGKKASKPKPMTAKDICPKCGAKRIDNQLGLEKTPEIYIEKLVEVFREVKRVLRDDGTVWLNLASSYMGSGGAHKENHNVKFKPKDLVPIPWMVAMALQQDGWWLRQDIIWSKVNPMPESATDRCTKAHEYIFLLTKSAKYYYDADAIRERVGEPTRRQKTFRGGCYTNNSAFDNSYDYSGHDPYSDDKPSLNGRNKRSVWTVATAPMKKAHFATFPPKLILPCVLAGTSGKGCCPECGGPWVRVMDKGKKIICGDRGKYKWASKAVDDGYNYDARWKGKPGQMYENKTTGWKPTCNCNMAYPDVVLATDDLAYVPHNPIPCTVLDPFTGAGTTGVVALENNRQFVGIELNEKYINEIAKPRLDAINCQLSLF